MRTSSSPSSPPALWIAALFLSACGGGAASDGDVILVTIDTLRADRIGLANAYGRDTSPRIDALFRDGLVYERCYSTEASTSPSVLSMLTGLHPQDHRVRLFYQLVPETTRILPQLLPAAYETAAFVSNMVLTDEAMGWADRFDHFDDYVDQREPLRPVWERDAERTTDAALLWLRTQRDPRRPLFLWVHYIDPHGPYAPPASWGLRFESDPLPIPIERVPAYQREPGLSDGNGYVDRYDSEVTYVDHHVARLLEGYGELRPLDEALVILTADHGESMMEHESWFTHGYQVYDEIVRVPLLLRGPGVPTGRSSALVSGIDLVPTILAFAGASSAAPQAGGVDLRRPDDIDPARLVFAEASRRERQWRTVVQGQRKWIAAVNPADRRIAAQKLFDLARDPKEERGGALRADDPLARALLERIAADPDPGGIPADARRGMPLSGEKLAPGVTDEQVEKLRALGYADG